MQAFEYTLMLEYTTQLLKYEPILKHKPSYTCQLLKWLQRRRRNLGVMHSSELFMPSDFEHITIFLI